MEVTLNGETRQLPDGLTVAQLLQDLKIQPERVAVEVNLTVLKRAQLPGVALQPGDQVEIVQLIGGGSIGAGWRVQGSGWPRTPHPEPGT